MSIDHTATTSFEAIKTALRTDMRTVALQLPAPIIFGHVCKGDLTRPGALRCSAIVSGSSGVVQPQDIDSHSPIDEMVFKAHVQAAGRDQTFLHLASLWALKAVPAGTSGIPKRASITCKVVRQSLPLTVSLSGAACTLTLSHELVDVLAPPDLVNSYLDALYSWAEANRESVAIPWTSEWATDRLRAAQVDAVLFCGTQTGADGHVSRLVETFSDGSAPVGSDMANAWYLPLRQVIGSLQFALLYLRRHQRAMPDNCGFVTTAAIANAPSGQALRENWRRPVGLISVPFVERDTPTEVIERVATILENGEVRTVLVRMEEPKVDLADIAKLPESSTKTVRQQMRAGVRAAFTGPAFDSWPVEASLWIAELARLSLGFKHEGKRLSFTFVLGDATQMEDCGAFECIALQPDSKEVLQYPPGAGTADEIVSTLRRMVQRELADENYCWFMGGRYALMWSATFPSLQPTHLVRLRESSWELFAATCRAGRRPTGAEQAVVVSYLIGGTGGGLIINGDHSFELTREGHWQRRGEQLDHLIQKYLNASPLGATPSEVGKIAHALCTVSSDPDRGCIVVVSKSNQEPPFRRMGAPWETHRGRKFVADGTGHYLEGLDEDELVALLGMDGAGVVWRDTQGAARVTFRRLVTAPEGGRKHLSEEAARALKGKGSRRWSASLVATREDVALVAVVSQDGPVYIASTVDVHSKVLLSRSTVAEDAVKEVDVVQIDDLDAVKAWQDSHVAAAG